MRRLVLLTALFALVPVASASAASYKYDIPELVEKPLIAVKRGTSIPVLLPSRMTTEFKKLYSAGRGRTTRYVFELGAARNCHSATACFVAEFRGRTGGHAKGKRKVTLAHHLTGWFTPTRCGASCASPGIAWEQDGVLYEIDAKLGTKKTERKILTRLANSAIRNGAR